MERWSLRTVLDRRPGAKGQPLPTDLAVHLMRQVLHLHGNLDQTLSASQVFLSPSGEVTLLAGVVSDARPLGSLFRELLLGRDEGLKDAATLPEEVQDVLQRMESLVPSERFGSVALCDLALARCQGPVSAGPGQVAALVRAGSPTAAASPPPTADDSDWQPSVGISRARPSTRAPPEASERPLELAERAPRPPADPSDQVQGENNYREEPAKAPRSIVLPLVLGVITLAFIALMAFLLLDYAAPATIRPLLEAIPSLANLPGLTPARGLVRKLSPPSLDRSVHSLVLDSHPSGALVEVEGQPLGVTPVALDNRYGAGAVHVRMTRRGYQPWDGTFEGGQDATLHAVLRRR